MSLGAPASAAGALYQGEAQQSALDQQASIQRSNSSLDLAKASVDASRQQVMGGEKIGAIQSAASAGGVTQSGSVLSVIGASAANSEMDRLNILHGGEVRSINADNQASMDELGATSAMKGAYMSAFGSLLSGAATTFGNTKGATSGTDYTDGDMDANDQMLNEDSASSAGESDAMVEEGSTASAATAVEAL
jgi:hypothetical protein